METDEEQRVTAFQLQFDNPVAYQIKIAEWNPEKDLLAVVTEDSKISLHRFNWQRLWTISPGMSITSLCWRPDGKAIAVGLEDGTVSLHDVENGKLLRSLKSHSVAVVSLNWEEDGQMTRDEYGSHSVYEDHTSRFFPPPPRVPRMSGLVSGETSFMEDSEDSYRELSNSQQRFNILCSGDKDGFICFSIFGIFPIGKINIHNFGAASEAKCRLLNASVHKLCHLIVMCSGELIEDREESENGQMAEPGMHGLHCLVLDTSIFWKSRAHRLDPAFCRHQDVVPVSDALQTDVIDDDITEEPLVRPVRVASYSEIVPATPTEFFTPKTDLSADENISVVAKSPARGFRAAGAYFWKEFTSVDHLVMIIVEFVYFHLQSQNTVWIPAYYDAIMAVWTVITVALWCRGLQISGWSRTRITTSGLAEISATSMNSALVLLLLAHRVGGIGWGKGLRAAAIRAVFAWFVRLCKKTAVSYWS